MRNGNGFKIFYCLITQGLFYGSGVEELEEALKILLKQGVRGTLSEIEKWLQMLDWVGKLPWISAFKKWEKRKKEIQLPKNLPKNLHPFIARIFFQWEEKGWVERIPPQGKFYWRNPKDWIFYGKKEDFFFTAKELPYYPIGYAMGRIESFLSLWKVEKALLQDILIASMEAIENAVKYSSSSPLIFFQKVEEEKSLYYQIEIYNPVSPVNVDEEIRRGKFSSAASLMRGIFITSKIFDEMDVDRNDKEGYVKFWGKKKIPA